MTISVLIPVYNRPKMILECLESIFNQTYQDIEIIIYNDGSTDETETGTKENIFFFINTNRQNNHYNKINK